jgi:light-independent protochlorophyllide reductase subunit N
MGIPEPRFLVADSALDLPPIGPHTVIAAASPYLYDATAWAKRERKATILVSPFPYGPDGARAFYEALGAAFGKTVSYAERERAAWASLAGECAVLRGRSVAFASDAMIELSLARTLRAAGATVPYVGTPNVYRKFHAPETALLDGVEIVERPDRFATFAKLTEHAPDLVVANLNIANALEGMGFAVKWSTELTFQPIHGFSGAQSLFGMFTASLRRHDALRATAARAGSDAHPISMDFFREEVRR